jgi:hypothetical protein
VRLIPAPYRILALVLLVLACIAAGAVAGLNIESNRRDAIELAQKRESDKAFQAALVSGKTHAANVIAWQRKAENYYRNWKERLDHEKDANLAQCEPAQAGVHAALLSGTWVGLYNAAWQPELAEGDTGGAAGEVAPAGPVTPREALDNVAINARLCAEDRKRHDELIDHLMETGAR